MGSFQCNYRVPCYHHPSLANSWKSKSRDSRGSQSTIEMCSYNHILEDIAFDLDILGNIYHPLSYFKKTIQSKLVFGTIVYQILKKMELGPCGQSINILFMKIWIKACTKQTNKNTHNTPWIDDLTSLVSWFQVLYNIKK